MLSSSGTTGAPKVVRLGQDKLLHTAASVASHLELGPEDRGFNPLPLFHINAEVVGVLSALVAGSSLVLDDRFHRSGFWDLMGRRSITWINAVPAIVSRLSALEPDETVPSSIRCIRSASAPLPVAVADRFEASTGIPVIETYGMTEAASQITAHPLSVPRRPGSVGLPVGVELRIVRQSDPVGSPLEAPEFHIGHVEIRGASVVEGYVGGTHQDRFSPDGWLRTGDLGHRDADGFLYLDARTDDVINRGGEKVLPREVEEAIGADAMIASVAVVGRDDPELGQVPVAYVVLRAVAGDDGVDHAPLASRRARWPTGSRRPWSATSCAPSDRSRSVSWRGCRPAPRARSSGACWTPPRHPSCSASTCGDDGRVAALAGTTSTGHPQTARSH